MLAVRSDPGRVGAGRAAPGAAGFAGKAGGRFLGTTVSVTTGQRGAWGSGTEFEAKFSSDTCSGSERRFFHSLPARSYF